MCLPKWIIDMMHFGVLSEQDIDPIIAGEFELQENKVLMENIWKECKLVDYKECGVIANMNERMKNDAVCLEGWCLDEIYFLRHWEMRW